MEYTPFRKNFYVEVPEIARMTPEEVEAYKEVQLILPLSDWVIQSDCDEMERM
jgi:hypothetical protein